jgi:hypothetical protein
MEYMFIIGNANRLVISIIIFWLDFGTSLIRITVLYLFGISFW